MRFLPITLICLFSLVFTSCETNSLSDLVDTTSPVATVTYQNTTKTIFNTSCVECHNPSNASGGTTLDTYEGAAIKAMSGEMLARMTNTENPMPPSGNLPDNVIEAVAQWIEDGVLEN